MAAEDRGRGRAGGVGVATGLRRGWVWGRAGSRWQQVGSGSPVAGSYSREKERKEREKESWLRLESEKTEVYFYFYFKFFIFLFLNQYEIFPINNEL